MRYAVVSQLSWIIWIAFAASGHPWYGNLAQVIVIVPTFFVMWRLQFGTWRLGQ